jgi:hypothetical protein
MKTKIVIGLLTVAAILGWTGMACVQTATSASKVQLPSEVAMWDLSGHWDVIVGNPGTWAQGGICPNPFRITQPGCA